MFPVSENASASFFGLIPNLATRKPETFKFDEFVDLEYLSLFYNMFKLFFFSDLFGFSLFSV